MSNKAIVDTVKLDEAKRVLELQQTLRLSQNAINLLLEAKFPGNYCKVVGETLDWLTAISKNVESQLPKTEPKVDYAPEPKVEAEVK